MQHSAALGVRVSERMHGMGSMSFSTQPVFNSMVPGGFRLIPPLLKPEWDAEQRLNVRHRLQQAPIAARP